MRHPGEHRARTLSVKNVEPSRREPPEPPSHTELHTRLVQEGIIARPVPDQAIFEEARDLMVNILNSTRRNGDEREGKALTDAELKAQARALGVDIGSKSTDREPIQVASFEV